MGDDGKGAVPAPQELQQACAELVRRLRADEPCQAEHFLAAFPVLAQCSDYAVELIYTEYVNRDKLGQHPSPADYYVRFPQWRDRLQRLIQVDDIFRDLGPAASATLPRASGQQSTEIDLDLGSADSWQDRYELLDKIGIGGMGVVYKARQTSLNRLVALKMMRHGEDATPEERARFRREAEAMARLQHPNIVQIHAVGELNGRPYLAMEFLEGGTLTAHVASRPQTLRQAAQWVETVARAVHYAHCRDILHRDLKPLNILLTADGIPKVSDFGLSKRMDSDGCHTWTGVAVGTPSYLSPEQAAGRKGEIGPRSDVYSLGAILYELLTGQPPFVAETKEATIQKVLTEEPVSPRARNLYVDRALEAICLKCLEKKPQDRYRTAEALAKDLDCWQRGKATTALPPWPTRAWRGVRRHSMMSAAVVLIGLTISIWMTVNYFWDPARQLESAQRKLVAGRPAILFAESGRLPWYRKATSQGDMRVEHGDDGTMKVRSGSLGLLELLPDPMCESYLIRAEVRHDDAYSKHASVGIYCAYSTQVTQRDEKVHLFYALMFNDWYRVEDVYSGPPVPGMKPPHRPSESKVKLVLRCLGAEEGTPLRDHATPVWGHFIPSGPYPVWRKIAMTVTPVRLEAHWEGKRIDQVSDATLARPPGGKFGELVHGVEWVFSLRGSVGLYVDQASASFRHVVIEPYTKGN